ncbi:MAG: hypothetical protein AAF700_10960 [Pseudomonadota bacterium]
MRVVIFSALLAPSALLADCAPVPERSERQSQLMSDIAVADSEAEARELSNALWEIWTTAPDEAAQEMLTSGMARRGSYDYLGALQRFNDLVAYCPDYAEGYNQRAFVHFLSGSFEKALADLDRTLAITPDHIGALSGRALTLLELGREREGQLALRAALAFNPWLPERFRLQPLEPDGETETDL